MRQQLSKTFIAEAELKPHPLCPSPLDLRACTWCGWRGKCGDCPHNDLGALCPSCGRGEKLKSNEA